MSQFHCIRRKLSNQVACANKLELTSLFQTLFWSQSHFLLFVILCQSPLSSHEHVPQTLTTKISKIFYLYLHAYTYNLYIRACIYIFLYSLKLHFVILFHWKMCNIFWKKKAPCFGFFFFIIMERHLNIFNCDFSVHF